MFVLATIGASALYLLFIWLVSAASSAWLAERKGYTERVGLMFGLILSAVGLVIVLLLPARPGSTWKREGPFPNPGARRPLGMPDLVTAAPESGAALGPALSDTPPADTAPPTLPADEDAPTPPAGGDAPQPGNDAPPAG